MRVADFFFNMHIYHDVSFREVFLLNIHKCYLFLRVLVVVELFVKEFGPGYRIKKGIVG